MLHPAKKNTIRCYVTIGFKYLLNIYFMEKIIVEMKKFAIHKLMSVRKICLLSEEWIANHIPEYLSNSS